jgi:hypothetical protein
MIPTYMLAKVYVKGSLKNNENGFELAVQNVVDSATLVGIGPLVVDGTSYPPEAITLVSSRGEWRGDALSYRNPAPFSFGAQARVLVQGHTLPPGEHSLTLTTQVGEAGRVQFTVKDVT